jgi:hypothetical protein
VIGFEGAPVGPAEHGGRVAPAPMPST